MIDKVAMFRATQYEKVKEEAKEIMGGKILDYEAKDIRNRGIQIGITLGKEVGRQESLAELITKMYQNGFTVEQISAAIDKSVEEIKEILTGDAI